MTIEELKFRYYNGETENPFADAHDPRARYWHQESTVADRPELALTDWETRQADMPFDVKTHGADAPEGNLAVVLSGYLNTKQWGDVAADFDDYFEAPVNGFAARPRAEVL